MSQTNKPKYSMWQNVGFMVGYARKYRVRVLLYCAAIAALKVGISLTELYISPVILGMVEQTAPLSRLLGTIALFSLGLFLLNGLRSYAETNTFPSRIEVRVKILNAINRKTCVTSYPNTLDPAVTKLREKANDAGSGNNEATEYIWTTLTELLVNITGFALYLLVLKELSVFLIVAVLVTTVTSFFVSKRINEWGYRHREEEARYQKKLNYIHTKAQSIQLAKDIRIFGLGDWLESIYKSTLRLYEAFLTRRERVYFWANVVDVVLSVARNGIAYFYLIRQTLTQGLPASQFLLYFTAVSGFTTWVTGILKEFSQLHKECLDISNVQEYLNLPEPFRFEGGDPVPKAEAYELRLENVSFRYPGSDAEIIHNMNLTIRPGERLAIVGLNGAGKTTLVKLLCGFYDPDEGRVLLNGKDIRSFNRQAYYDLFSAVFQEYSELDITVAENVAQSVTDIDRNRVADCLEKAGLTKMVAELPAGMDTHVGRKVYLDGVQFSGGQTQRLMLARALYKDGPILMLDEPTAALDPIAENDIYQKYAQMTAGKTSVFISHRLASTRFCDRIIFLEHGEITEEGTHEELLKLGSGYAKLFQVQSQYYQEGSEPDGKED